MRRIIGLVAMAIMGMGAGREAGVGVRLERVISMEGVEGRWDHFGVDREGKRLYVAALGNDSVEVIDVGERKRVGSVKGMKRPTGVRVMAGGEVVVASGGDGKVRVYDSGMKLMKTIGGLEDADNVRLDAGGKAVLVGYGEGAIAVIDPGAGKVVGTVEVGGHPESFQVERGGKRVFVNVPSKGEVVVVDREKMGVVARWKLEGAGGNFPMALDEGNKRLFVGCREPARVLVFDTGTGREVATLRCCGDTDDLYYDGAGKCVYVTGGEGKITVFRQVDADHYEPAGEVETAAGARTSVFVAETRKLYVAVPKRGGQGAEVREYSVGEAGGRGTGR